MLLVLTADLLWRSRIESALAGAGVQVRWMERAAELEGAAEPEQFWVDLTAPEAIAAIAEARSRFPRCRIVAFGPHLDRDQARQARQAGTDEVLGRGAFLARYLSG